MATFTDNYVKGLKPRERIYEERDRGCPGLIIRVGQRGQKVWEVVISRNDHRERKRLGTYPELSLAAARRDASDAKKGGGVHAPGMRVRDLWKLYSAEMKAELRSFRDVEYAWNQWGEPVLGNVRLDDLSMRHGADLIDRIVKASTPNRAQKVIRYFMPMLKFAAGRSLITGNPWAGLHLPKGSDPRERVLSRAEWLALWEWAQREPYPWGPVIQGLMLSGQRLGEVAGMRWEELDFERQLWVIPSARHKGQRLHEVALSGALADLLAAQPRHDEYVFSTRKGLPVVPGSKLKGRISKATGLSEWRFHDVRRTAATYMSEGGVGRFILSQVLGHSDRTVTGIYDRATYRDEKRAALEVLAATVPGPGGSEAQPAEQPESAPSADNVVRGDFGRKQKARADAG